MTSLGWYPMDELPGPMVACCRSGLDAYQGGTARRRALPAAGRRRPRHTSGRPGPHPPPPARPPTGPSCPCRLRVFAERAVGRITRGDGGVLGAHRQPGVAADRARRRHLVPEAAPWAEFHDREVAAYRTWVRRSGHRLPSRRGRYGGADHVVVTRPGREPLHGMVLDTAAEARVQRSGPSDPRPAPQRPRAERRHLGSRGRGEASPRRSPAAPRRRGRAPGPRPGRRLREAPRPALVPTHEDLQYRNVLLSDGGEPLLFDFERAEYATATRTWVRIGDTWTGRPSLRAAFLRRPAGAARFPGRNSAWASDPAFDAVSAIAHGTGHDDPEVTERGLRTLRRLHTVFTAPVAPRPAGRPLSLEPAAGCPGSPGTRSSGHDRVVPAQPVPGGQAEHEAPQDEEAVPEGAPSGLRVGMAAKAGAGRRRGRRRADPASRST
ncbi:hypothetical protein ACU686_22365 [Yinghuangia aomiensis]